MRMTFSRARVAMAVATVVACCKDDEPKVGNGVNDVRLACDIRATWNRSGNECTLCEASVVSERCDCIELRDFSAACIDQANARRAACTGSVNDCVFACATTDCACIDACYVAGDACKAASAARDGCIAEACSSYCR